MPAVPTTMRSPAAPGRYRSAPRSWNCTSRRCAAPGAAGSTSWTGVATSRSTTSISCRYRPSIRTLRRSPAWTSSASSSTSDPSGRSTGSSSTGSCSPSRRSRTTSASASCRAALLRSPCGSFYLQLVEADWDASDSGPGETLRRIGFGTADVPAAMAALASRGITFIDNDRVRPSDRGAVTQALLGGVMFELVHRDAR